MVFAYDGLAPPPALRRRIARGEAAGVILFARNVRSAGAGARRRARPAGDRATARAARAAHRHGRPGGRPGAADPGRAGARGGATSRTAGEARADGRAAARTLRGAGVNMDLAPVADVARPGARSTASGASTRARPRASRTLAGAFAQGLQAGGVRATAKHYPGFGAATVNTDDAPARIDRARWRMLREVDARPFAALVDARRRRRDGVDRVYPARRRAPRGVRVALGRPTSCAAGSGFRGVRDDRRPRHARRPGLRLDRATARCSPCRRASTCRSSPRPTRQRARRRGPARRGEARRCRAGAACAPRPSACWRCAPSFAACPPRSDRRGLRVASQAAPRCHAGVDGSIGSRCAPAVSIERHGGARGLRGGGVVARALRRRRSRRSTPWTRQTGTPSGMRRIGSACAQRSGTSAGVPPSSATATRPARPMSQTAASASTRSATTRGAAPGAPAAARRRPAAHSASWPPAEWPSERHPRRGRGPRRRGRRAGRSPRRRRRTSSASRRRRGPRRRYSTFHAA